MFPYNVKGGEIETLSGFQTLTAFMYKHIGFNIKLATTSIQPLRVPAPHLLAKIPLPSSGNPVKVCLYSDCFVCC